MRAFISGLVVVLVGLSLLYFAPAQVMKRSAEKAIEALNEAAATKDRANITAALGKLLADDAKIHLEVHFFSLTAPDRPIVQDFADKESFIAFIDNVLYPLTDMEYRGRLREFEPSDDKTSAAVKFTSFEWGDGASLYGGASVDVRYSSDTTCEGVAQFSQKLSEQPVLSEAKCEVHLRMRPKAGQEGKFRDMNAIQDLLKQ